MIERVKVIKKEQISIIKTWRKVVGLKSTLTFDDFKEKQNYLNTDKSFQDLFDYCNIIFFHSI